jgi:Pyruvate/2-oxoacid:ferredoxin oxidoreductase delta subunit
LRADAGGALQPGVIAGGDALGLGIAGQAIVQGRLAAEQLHARLRGQAAPAAPGHERPTVGPGKVQRDFYESRPAAHRSQLSPEARLANPEAEVTAGLAESQFLDEASRCFSCGSCFGCQQCAMYCTAHGFVKLEHPSPGMYYAMSLDHCEQCGKCLSVCPCGYLEIKPAS